MYNVVEIDKADFLLGQKQRVGNFGTFVPPNVEKGEELKIYRVSADGHPDLQGRAIGEQEAIEAYKLTLGLA